jgi:hypothetical protein
MHFSADFQCMFHPKVLDIGCEWHCCVKGIKEGECQCDLSRLCWNHLTPLHAAPGPHCRLLRCWLNTVPTLKRRMVFLFWPLWAAYAGQFEMVRFSWSIILVCFLIDRVRLEKSWTSKEDRPSICSWIAWCRANGSAPLTAGRKRSYENIILPPAKRQRSPIQYGHRPEYRRGYWCGIASPEETGLLKSVGIISNDALIKEILDNKT